MKDTQWTIKETYQIDIDNKDYEQYERFKRARERKLKTRERKLKIEKILNEK